MGEMADQQKLTALAARLRDSKRKHYECEDSWYSCPKAEGGCYDGGAGRVRVAIAEPMSSILASKSF